MSLAEHKPESDHIDLKDSSSHFEHHAEVERGNPITGKHDPALDLLQNVAGGRREITAEEDKRVLRKIDWHLMPVMVVLYWFQFFDKQTLSFASVFGLQTDVGLHGTQYSWVGSITYFAWFASLPITAYVMVRMRMSLFIPLLALFWGANLACMAAAHNYVGLLVSRFTLGGLEACLAPAFILVGQTWYKRSEQGWRAAIWYSQNAWVNIFGSLIAYGLGKIHSKVLHTYQIIFLITGVVTVAFAVGSFWLFPDSPVRNNFLTEDEKVIAVERLRHNQQGIQADGYQWSQVLEAVLDLKTWSWVALLLLVSIPSGGISVFGPLILSGFGYTGAQALLLNIPFGVMQLLVIFLSFWASTRYKTKSIIMILLMIPCLTGAALLYALPTHQLGGRLFGYYIVACYTPITPLILSWQGTNTSGHSKKTATTALAALGQAAGNIIGPLLFSADQKPTYHPGLRAVFICFCIFMLVVILADLNLWRLNKRNEKRRVAEGKSARVNDYSMMTAKEAEAARAASGGADEAAGAHAFDDITDLKNSDFIYVY